jgi:hypothetical protein
MASSPASRAMSNNLFLIARQLGMRPRHRRLPPGGIARIPRYPERVVVDRHPRRPPGVPGSQAPAESTQAAGWLSKLVSPWPRARPTWLNPWPRARPVQPHGGRAGGAGLAVLPSNPGTVPKFADALPIPEVLQPIGLKQGEPLYRVRMRNPYRRTLRPPHVRRCGPVRP